MYFCWHIVPCNVKLTIARFHLSLQNVLQLQQLDHGAFESHRMLRSADYTQFSSVCEVHSAHERTFQCAYHSFRATAHLGATFKKTELFSSAPAPFAFSSQVDAKVAAQCISFFPFFSRSPDSYAKVL